MSELPERDFRRNSALLATDYISFGIGMTFLGPTTILPSLIRLLGGSQVVVGLLGTIMAGCWYLPHLFVGRYLAGRPLVKKYVILSGVASRAFLALTLPVLMLFAVRAPGVALTAFLLTYGGFALTDALAGVGWFDLLAKTIPLEQRGRAMGAAQALSSLAAIGVGVIVRAILARPDPFPANYVLLIFLAVAFMSICPFAISFMREPRGAGEAESALPWRKYLPRLLAILRHDRRFAWVTVAGWVAALADMGGSFYVLYAADRLHLPQETIGLFISAWVVGGLLSGVVFGPLGDRKGSASVVMVAMVLRCLPPTLALLTPLVAGRWLWLAPGVLMLIFVTMGIVGGAYMIGFTNYMLEIAPASERAQYVALTQTLGIVTVFAPMVAGWLVQEASYEVLFVVTLTLAVIGMGVALRRPVQAMQL